METSQENKKRAAKKEADRKYRLTHSKEIKECRRLHYIKNKDEIDRKHLEYYHKNLNKVKALQKDYYYEHSDKIKDYARSYYKENSEKIKKYQKDYRKNNIEKINKRVRNYNKTRYHTNLHYKLKKSLSRRILDALKNKNLKKNFRTEVLLGCSIKEAYKHLESLFKEGMTRHNNTTNGWHIDHIKPISSFDLSDPVQLRACFHYSNLQPLWWWENLEKSDKIVDTV